MSHFHSLCGICRKSAYYIHPIKTVQMIKMHGMIIQILCRINQVTGDSRIRWRFNAKGIFARQNSGFVMSVCTNTAKTLNHQTGIAGIAAFQYRFNTAPEGDTAPSVFDNVIVIDLHFNS